MAIDSTHPFYDEFIEDWVKMRDLYKGERAIKQKGQIYLPATKSMRLDGMSNGQLGRELYDAYKLRAVFHDFIKDAVESYIGLMFKKNSIIELPSALEPMRNNATVFSEPLEMLLRRIYEEQLITGRLGLMLDLPVNTGSRFNLIPYIATYNSESIRNWDDREAEEGFTNLNLVLLDESGYERGNDFEWVYRKKYRILKLNEEGANPLYEVGLHIENQQGELGFINPTYKGKFLNKIPFVFINSKDITSFPDEPPLMPLGNLALAIYRGEADYRGALHLQGQDTLVTIGDLQKSIEDEGQPVRVGPGSMLNIEVGGDAKYIGVNSQGLPEQRMSLENDLKRADVEAGKLLDSSSDDLQSGVALQTKLGARTATLNQIAITGAAGLEKILKIAAEWVGANPNEVKVIPNLEFSDFNITGRDLVDWMTARTMGAPISKKSIHNKLVSVGLTKLDYETELDEISEENGDV